ncbi:PQQ-dependent sugar dehydrogenase [Paraglaciecola sp.]|uniref:PQQ-dependent sugar dehydrogenase n=1 Tax=Paraglaciecola sp. TaxID=1920173 RepID=UPI00326730BB
MSFSVQAIQLKKVVTGLEQPVDIKFFPGSHSELLIAGKKGQLTFAHLNQNEQYSVHTFHVKSGSEMGLLGLAFHPDYSHSTQITAGDKNNFLFVNYFPKEGTRRTRISRFLLTKKDREYRLSNEKVILEIQQPYSNHNGGQIAFGPDGYLYIGMGDGGSAGDPQGHGQNTQTLLGNMLRIDINTTNNVPYGIPSDNPYVKHSNFKPEIWAFGLRNPWRFSFSANVLITADVGQYKYEEISVIEKGQNYGWNTMEASHCYQPKTLCNTDNLTLPKLEYGRSEGQSITGGYIYTGNVNSRLINHYIYADFVSGNIWGVKYPDFTNPTKLLSNQGNISTFAVDNQGELYLAGFSKGIIYQIVP